LGSQRKASEKSEAFVVLWVSDLPCSA